MQIMWQDALMLVIRVCKKFGVRAKLDLCRYLKMLERDSSKSCHGTNPSGARHLNLC
jgi:hypothetical protein